MTLNCLQGGENGGRRRMGRRRRRRRGRMGRRGMVNWTFKLQPIIFIIHLINYFILPKILTLLRNLFALFEGISDR
jgi:hypothetical protein